MVIARLLISQSITEIKNQLHSHIVSGKVNYPDVLYFKQGEKLGIAEARKIKEHFSLKPYSAKGRTVILEDAGGLTPEAQNALLKTIEELPLDAELILGAESEANLLPTILSRCQVTRIQSAEFRVQNHTEDIEKLVNSTIEQRFLYVEKLKDKEGFLLNLISFFHQKSPADSLFLKELLQAEQWNKQNVNLRAILEYLMLVMPMEK